MRAPSHHAVRASKVHQIALDGGALRLLAGEYGTHSGHKGAHLPLDCYDIRPDKLRTATPEYPQINRWLASNCFGDWCTREGLTDRERELITFCPIAARGGCEPQLTAHARANMKRRHGAKAGSRFSHIAFAIPSTETSNEWLEPVNAEGHATL